MDVTQNPVRLLPQPHYLVSSVYFVIVKLEVSGASRMPYFM